MNGTVLLLGAGGFLGGFIEAALHRAGWRVRRVLRRGEREGDVALDLGTMAAPGDWTPWLDGVDAVVNAAGILREGRDRFDAIHHRAPMALAQACAQRGIARFVQISALGDPADGEFIASKHRFDEALRVLMPHALVLRPSVVYSTAGSYGGTSLMRGLAAMPGVLVVPAAKRRDPESSSGDNRGGLWLQPMAAEDLAELVVRGLEDRVSGTFELGGPRAMTLEAYLLAWRAWLRVPGRRVARVPAALAGLVVAIGERLGRGPLGATPWRMLRRGNVTAPGAHAAVRAAFGAAPRALGEVLAALPSQVQDRWHAGLVLLAAPLKWLTVALWLLSAWAGWRTPAAQIEALAAGSALAWLSPVALARGAALLDLALAAWLVLAPGPRWPLAAMIASVLAYTIAFGTLQPALWLDPLGGLAKNLLVLPALAVLWLVSERRR